MTVIRGQIYNSGCTSVQEYIGRQAEHHRVRTFREEEVEFLQKSGVTYDSRDLDRAGIPPGCGKTWGVGVRRCRCAQPPATC